MKSAIFKTFFLSLMIVAQVHFAFAQTASILPPAKTTFFDANGNPLAAGTVDFYIPSTTTRKTTWQDAAETIPNANPVVLDSAGRALILGSGSYRQVVKDSNGNLIWDQVTSSTGSGGGSTPTATGDGDLVGTIKPWAGMTAPNQYAFTYGQELSRTTFSALFTAITSTQAVFCNSGSPILNGLSDTTNFWIGMTVETTCVVAGFSTIISKTSNSVTLAANSNVTTNSNAIFFPWGHGNGSTTFNLPDFRGFAIAGNVIMGGVASSNLTTQFFGSAGPSGTGSSGGNQSFTLVRANLPNTNVPVTITDPGHFHTYTQPSFAGIATTDVTGNHTVATATANTSTSTTGISAAFNLNGSVTQTAFSLVQPTKTSNYIIKITPDTNSATASGVTSLGGMTGDIACGTGLTCTGNIISNSITPTTTTVKYLKSYGVVADGVTDNTLAMNTAISDANSSSGSVTFIVPTSSNNSCILVNSSLNAITANNVFFQGEGSPEESCFKFINNGFTWSTLATAVDGGGLRNVGFDGDSGVNDAMIVLPQAARMKFDNINLRNGVSQLAQIGTLTTTSSQITFTRLRGLVANITAPLITAVNGSGLFIYNFDVFVNTTLGSQASGRHFVAFSQGSWDTSNISDGISQLFDAAIVLAANTGQVVQNIRINNNFFDGMNQGIITTAAAGTTIYSLEVFNNEITGNSSNCISASGTGSHLGYKIQNNRIIQCNQYGISLPASASVFSITGNHIYAVNRAAGAFDAINIAAGATIGFISSNDLGTTLTGTLTGTPRFGLFIGNSTSINIANNIANGSTSGCSIGTLTTSTVRNNLGYTASVADTSCIDTPAISVAQGGTGLTSGTSGGIPYFSSSTAMSSSAALAANTVMVGGGAGTAPSTPATTPMTETTVGIVGIQNTTGPSFSSALGTGGSLNSAGGASFSKTLNAQQINAVADLNGVGNWHVAATGATNPNKQVWFGFDTTNNRGFLQAIFQGTANEPMMINPLGGNVVIGAQSNGSNTLDVTGTIGSTSSIKSSGATNGIGYTTGAGGAVTQLTSRTTGVTLNTVTGAITLFAAAPTVGTWVSFTVTDSAVTATDIPHVAFKSGTNTYIGHVTSVAAGSFQISFTSIVGTASDSPVINFDIIKGSIN